MHIEDFDTLRLCVQNWAPMLDEPSERAALEDALAPILIPEVLQHLPPSLKLDQNTQEARHQWVTRLSYDAEVYVIKERPFLRPIGLLILAAPSGQANAELHLGYLLSPQAWGHGFATEILNGLVDALPKGEGLSLIGGVNRNNPASARVLKKTGFEKDLARQTADTDFYVLTK